MKKYYDIKDLDILTDKLKLREADSVDYLLKLATELKQYDSIIRLNKVRDIKTCVDDLFEDLIQLEGLRQFRINCVRVNDKKG